MVLFFLFSVLLITDPPEAEPLTTISIQLSWVLSVWSLPFSIFHIFRVFVASLFFFLQKAKPQYILKVNNYKIKINSD